MHAIVALPLYTILDLYKYNLLSNRYVECSKIYSSFGFLRLILHFSTIPYFHFSRRINGMGFFRLNVILRKRPFRLKVLQRCCYYCTIPKAVDVQSNGTIELLGKTYSADHMTNIRPSLVPKIGINLHNMNNHPLNLLKRRIETFFYKSFLNRYSNPLFSVYDAINPVVTLEQNFDSLLVPIDHVSRKKSDSFYLNSQYMLRAHTSAHQSDLIRSGLNAFLVFGDVYRRDTIDASHYPVFHQAEGVRMFTEHEVLENYIWVYLFIQNYIVGV